MLMVSFIVIFVPGGQIIDISSLSMPRISDISSQVSFLDMKLVSVSDASNFRLCSTSIVVSGALIGMSMSVV